MLGELAPVATTGLDVGLLVAALLLGLRHGVDWDHIAAITDITASQETPRRGVWLGSVYALGHAAMVFALGLAAIVLGERLPPSFDAAMGRLVGVTLVALGVYVGVSIVRHGRQFRMQSRWMLVISAMRRIHRWVRERSHRNGNGVLTHEHAHVTATSFHHEPDGESPLLPDARSHTHRHRHDNDELPAGYDTGAALTIGVLHGMGAETPTQVLIFLAAAGAGGASAGVAALTLFLVGLFTANSVVTVASAFGFLSATRHPRVYLGFGVLTVVVSLGVGLLFLAGREAALPILVGG